MPPINQKLTIMIYRVETQYGIMDYNSLTDALEGAKARISKKYDCDLLLIADDGLTVISETSLAWHAYDGGYINASPLALLPIIKHLEL